MRKGTSAANPHGLLPTLIKASLILGGLGSALGIAATVLWSTSGAGDTLAIGVFTVLVGGILGSMFGTLGTVTAYFAATKMVSAEPAQDADVVEASAVETRAVEARGTEASVAKVSASQRWICALAFAVPNIAIALLMNIVSLDLTLALLVLAIGVLLLMFAYFAVAPRILND